MDFRVPQGPFEPPLEDRVRLDQSQGYEPCGLNLGRLLLNGESTPPRYARGAYDEMLFFFSMPLRIGASLRSCSGLNLGLSLPPRYRLLNYGKCVR